METAFEYNRIAAAPDLADLIQVYQEVFDLPDRAMPKDAHIQHLLNSPSTIFLAAYSGNRVVGGLTAYLLPSVYSELNELYLYDLAVLAEFQRKGIGRGLLSALKGLAGSMNVSEVYVQADADDGGALAFYLATGGQEEEVWHFVYPVGLAGTVNEEDSPLPPV